MIPCSEKFTGFRKSGKICREIEAATSGAEKGWRYVTL
jgi:hypothetical protein